MKNYSNLKVVVLDSNYQFVHVESIKKAIRKLINGKAEMVKSTGKTIWRGMLEPLVIRLLKSISHFYNRVLPWSKNSIYLRDGGKCQYCGVVHKSDIVGSRMTIDHIIPQCRGGKNTYQNTVLACLNCNQKKGDKSLEDSGLTLSKQPRAFTLFDAFSYKMKNMNFDYNSIYY